TARNTSMKVTRRGFATAAGAAMFAGWANLDGRKHRTTPAAASAGNPAVAIVKAASYSADLASRMLEGIRTCGLDVRGKRVLLKPNLVEFDPNTCINTDVSIVAAAYDVFRGLGAAEVKI